VCGLGPSRQKQGRKKSEKKAPKTDEKKHYPPNLLAALGKLMPVL